MGWHQKYRDQREKAANSPRIEVDEQEFVRRCIAAGMSESDAELQLKVAKGLGSDVLIGNELLSVSGLE